MTSVFISHSSLDKKFARRIAKDLALNGVRVWIDESELNVGDSLLQKIAIAIEDMRYLAVILTPNSVGSSWVQKELAMAMSIELDKRQIKVLPIVAEKCSVPLFLRDKLQARMCTDKQYKSEFPKILRAINSEQVDIDIHNLSSKDEETRIKSIKSLRQLKDINAVMPICRLLQSDRSEKVRVEAAISLGEFGDRRAVNPLIKSLSDTSDRVKQFSIYSLERLRDEKSIDPLINVLKDINESDFIRGQSAESLCHLRSKKALPILTDALKNKNTPQYVRGKIARNLVIYEGQEVIECLIEALDDEDDEVRQNAIVGLEEDVIYKKGVSLKKIKPKRLTKTLGKLIEDDNNIVRFTAILLLDQLSLYNDIGLFIKALTDQDYVARSYAVQALIHIGDASIQPVTDMLKDNRVYVRKDAAFILGRIGNKKSIESLKFLLDDKNRIVRDGAQQAIVSIKRKNK